MGLDWNPLGRAKDGFEAEFSELLDQYIQTSDGPSRHALAERIVEISDAAFEVLGAPRVGHDEAANAWVRGRLEELGRQEETTETLHEMEGHYVLDLVPDSPGLPMYTSWGYEGVDRYTFRGAFLDDVEDVLGAELYEKAWRTMTAEGLLEYGRELLDVARAHARRCDLEYLEHQRAIPEADEGSEESRTHILYAAAKWCLWWAERGHGLAPYY